MLFAKKIVAPLAFAGLVSAAPLSRRATYTDGDILNYALTLEHLEATFYAQGLAMYNAGAFKDANLPEWVRYRITEIANQESTHVSALTSALKSAGVTPVAACTYNFAITSPAVFLATAQVLEGVGVSAYLGAAPGISSKAYLAVAGSILVVEAEHSTWIRSAAQNEDGFPRPFAPYLGLNQVYSLAAGFIKSCPSTNPTLPLKAFPALSVTTTGTLSVGQKITLALPKGLSGTVYAAFVDAVATTYQKIDVSGSTASVTIPAGMTGQGYIVLTNSNTAFGDAVTVAGPAIIEVPAQATTFSYCSPGSTC